jgi:polysaccharide chain length determinant protein (PEP-CTERM system associated)
MEVRQVINPGKTFNIHDYIEIFLRRIWYIIIPFIVVMIGAVLYAYHSPKLYKASTLILVTPQKVPEAFVRPTVTSGIEERLQSIGQEIMSRTRLEQVISEFKLYQDEAKSISMEEVVELMKKNITIEIKGKEGYFTISYIGKDPKIVTLITNKLASLVIEENLKMREQQAQGTSEFLTIELNATKAKLEKQEKTITKYKKQFTGELPEQRDANIRVLDQLQLLYQRIGESLRAAQDRKLIIQKQLSDIELLVASEVNKRDKEGVTSLLSSSSSPTLPLELQSNLLGKNDPQEIQLEQLKNQLADLQLKYTEKHPDILITKKKIADLEARIEKTKLEKELEEKKDSELQMNPSDSIKVSSLPVPKMEKKSKQEDKPDFKLNPQYKQMEAQLIATELEIERLLKEEVKIKSQMDKYRERIENTFLREQDLSNLTRDYENTKNAYASLLTKSQEAQQAENLERRQKGEQFKVIDPARIPEKPFKPDIPRILLFGLLLGMCSGFGMAFFREQMDHSFRDAEDLEATLGFKVLANIPKIEKKIEKEAA